MSDDTTARLQIATPERVRRRLKSQAAEHGLDMSVLGSVVLDYGLGLIAADKAPPALKALIEQAKAARDATGE